MIMEKPIAAFWMGFSVSGKDTQAQLLSDFFSKRSVLRLLLNKILGNRPVLWISVGDILRAMAKSGTYAGRIIDEKVMKAGNFSLPFVATGAWAGMVMRELRAGQHVIFPSSPRTLEEAHDLSDFAEFFNLKACPIFIDVSEDEVFRRLKARGRADDTDG